MTFNIKTEFIFCFLIVGAIIISSCKTQKSVSSDEFQNSFMVIKGLACTEIINPDAIDSKVGKIDCGSISFHYDYGRYSNQGPISPKEEFRRTFDTYHHIKFFENRMIDPKVYKIFLDSVKVIKVERKKPSDKLMFACDPCNATAELTFKGDTYFYPITLSEKQLSMEGFTCSFEEKNGFVHKYYTDREGKQGLYINPVKNRYKKKKTLSLVVDQTALTVEEIEYILRKVSLR